MKVIKAREIQVPKNLPELIDAKAEKPVGTLRNMLADEGKLHKQDRYLLGVSLGLEIKKIMSSTELPAEPMTLTRLADMMNVLMLAYTLGTMRFSSDGELLIGGVSDMAIVGEMLQADKFEFRDGTQVDSSVLLPVIGMLNSEKAMKEIYGDIVGRGVFKKKKISLDDAMHLAQTVLDCSDQLPKAGFWTK